MKNYILSIETAFEGGSIAILSDHLIIDEWEGKQEVSKAEEVLEQISTLLNRHEILKEQIKLIVISSGAGSSTGEKIGQAIAKGLRKSLDCRIIQVSTHESLLSAIENTPDGEYLSAIPNGKGGYEIQIFTIKDNVKERKDAERKICGANAIVRLKKSVEFKGVILPTDIKVSDKSKTRLGHNFKSLAAINGRIFTNNK